MALGDVVEITAPARGFGAGVWGMVVSIDDRTDTVTLAIDCEGQPPLLVNFDRHVVGMLSL